jgi:chitinase
MNYKMLIQAIRGKFDARSSVHKIITIAHGMAPKHIEYMKPVAIHEVLDWVNTMSYDYNGYWNDHTGHLAALYNSDVIEAPYEKENWTVDGGIQLMIANGVPPSKLVLGVPFYGRSWRGVQPGSKHGLWQVGEGPGCGSFERANYDYYDLNRNIVGKKGFVRHWDSEAKVPYLYNELTGEFVTYEDKESLTGKVDYVNQKGLGGVMFWEQSNDERHGSPDSLVKVITDNLNGCSGASRRAEDIQAKESASGGVRGVSSLEHDAQRG